jgi:DNA-binding NarL/FixJ family response regulator
MRLKVLIADAHRLMLAGIRLALADAPDIEVVGAATSGAQVLPLVARTSPGLVLLDLRLPGMDGLRCVDALRERFPEVKAVLLSGTDETEVVEAAFRHGAAGFVLKRIDPADLAPVLRQIADGNVYYPHGTDALAADGPESMLTRREGDILRAVADGLSNKEIARQLWLSEQTIKFHLTNIYRKLGVCSRTAAVHHAYEHGLIENPLLTAA